MTVPYKVAKIDGLGNSKFDKIMLCEAPIS